MEKITTGSAHWDKCLATFNLQPEVIQGIASLRHDDGVIIGNQMIEIRTLKNRLLEIKNLINGLEKPEYGSVGIPEWMDKIEKLKLSKKLIEQATPNK